MYQNQNFKRQNNKGGYRGNYRNENYDRGRGRSRERSIAVTSEGITEEVVTVGQGQDKE